MIVRESPELLHLHSPFLALACARQFPMICQFGVESGGRLRRHIEQNLLKPGLGITSQHAGKNSRQQPAILRRDGDTLHYTANEGLQWTMQFQDERTFRLRLRPAAGQLQGEFFRMVFSPEVCPVTAWGRWIGDKPYPPAKQTSIFDVPDMTADFHLPLLLHFPDYGGLKITSASAGVFARQTVAADPTEVGLNLGCHNTGYHTSRRAYHCGAVTLAFHAPHECEEVELRFSVEPEHYPQISGVDLSGPQWNGLKRCWQNAFTLNVQTLSMGDNPVLDGIAHLAVHFKSDMSVFTPPLLENLTVHDVLRRQLEITFRNCVGESGEIHQRHADPQRRGQSSDYGFFDSNISSLIALYNYTAATGDWTLLRNHLDSIRRAARFLLALDRDGDGILELPFDGNAFREDRECRNWWDNFSFGHKDAFVNLLAYRAFGDLAEMLEHERCTGDVAALRCLRDKFAHNFHSTFFNPSTGVYAGWISADGKVHDYLFTFISAMAINMGLVEPSLAKQVMQTLLEALRAAGYGGWKWGIPGPVRSVSESDGHIWHPMQRWGSYENGGFCGQTAYHFIQALYTIGLRQQADEILFAMLDTYENQCTHSGVFPGYMRSVDWRTIEGIPCGYNYLADNYYFLLAAMTGHFGVSMPKVIA